MYFIHAIGKKRHKISYITTIFIHTTPTLCTSFQSKYQPFEYKILQIGGFLKKSSPKKMFIDL